MATSADYAPQAVHGHTKHFHPHMENKMVKDGTLCLPSNVWQIHEYTKIADMTHDDTAGVANPQERYPNYQYQFFYDIPDFECLFDEYTFESTTSTNVVFTLKSSNTIPASITSTDLSDLTGSISLPTTIDKLYLTLAAQSLKAASDSISFTQVSTVASTITFTTDGEFKINGNEPQNTDKFYVLNPIALKNAINVQYTTLHVNSAYPVPPKSKGLNTRVYAKNYDMNMENIIALNLHGNANLTDLIKNKSAATEVQHVKGYTSTDVVLELAQLKAIVDDGFNLFGTSENYRLSLPILTRGCLKLGPKDCHGREVFIPHMITFYTTKINQLDTYSDTILSSAPTNTNEELDMTPAELDYYNHHRAAYLTRY